MRSVDPNTVPVWRWVAAVASLVMLAAVVAWAVIAPTPPVSVWLRSGLPFITAVLLAVWCWWYPAAKYHYLDYQLDDTGLTVKQGILWRVQSSVSRTRIQHTDVSQGPLQRKYGVATLKLYTAGSNYTRIELPGLAYENAMSLRDDLQRKQLDESNGGGGDAI